MEEFALIDSAAFKKQMSIGKFNAAFPDFDQLNIY